MIEAQKVSRYFDKAAVTFDSLYSENTMIPLIRFVNRNFRSDIYERFILSVEHVSKYKLNTILDVGCGSGRYDYTIAKQGAKRVVGVDISSQMIDLAVKITRTIENAENIFDFVCCDFMEYQTDETFDVIIAMGLFDYVEDPVSMLRKMQSMAHHSVIASFPSTSFYRTPIRKVRYYFKQCPLHFYNPDKINLLSSQAGFDKNRITKIKGAGMDYFVAFFK